MNFRESLTLLLIDKLVLGALIGAVIFFVQRHLEKFRAGMAVQAEIGKIRAQKLGETWETFGRTETRLVQLLMARRRIIEEEAAKLDSETLVNLQSQKLLPPAARERISNELTADLEQTFLQAQEIPLLIEQHRFWTGESLYHKQIDYFTDLKNLVVAIPQSLYSADPILSLDVSGHVIRLALRRPDLTTLLQEV